MNLGRKLTRAEAATAVRGLAATALAFGGFMLLLPGPASGVIGLRAGRKTRALLRVAGVRDLVLGALLVSASRDHRRDATRTAAALLAGSQVADVGLAGVLFLSGIATWRGLVTIVGGAVPTAAAALAVFDNYRTE